MTARDTVERARGERSPFVLWLSESREFRPALVGQKAFGVARLLAAGFDSPMGFDLTTASWRAFAAENGVPLTLDLATLTPERLSTLSELVTFGAWPPDLVNALEMAWEQLAAEARWPPLRVAVRSSVVAEDLPEASFAGQYCTVLNVADVRACERAVRASWTSSFSDRAITYIKSQGIRELALENAVLIQELVPALSAGTAFSVNPVTGRRDELLVESSWGLGQTVVGGLVTPDTIFLDRATETLRIKTKRVGSKTLAFLPSAAETIDPVQLPQSRATALSLSDDEVLRLGAIVLEVERRLAAPQDVEWALEKDTFYLLQARPITALVSYPGDDIQWEFVVKKRLAWFTEMLQLEGLSGDHYAESLRLAFEIKNAKMISYHEYLDANEVTALNDLLAARQREDLAFLPALASRAYAICSEVLASTESLNRDFSGAAPGELVEVLRGFSTQMLRLIPIIYTEPDVDNILLERLRQQLPSASEDRVNELFVAITSARGELSIVTEQRDLLDIAAHVQLDSVLLDAFKTRPPEAILALLPVGIRNRLESHRRRYAWINTDDVFGRPWEIEDFLPRLEHLVLSGDCQRRLTTSSERQQQREQAFLAAVEDLHPDAELRILMDASRTYAHLRTHRAEAYIRSLFFARPLIAEVGRQLELAYDEAVAFSHEELEVFLETGTRPDRGEVRRRRLASAYIMVDRRVTAYFGAPAVALALREGFEDLDETADVTRADFLQGTPANLGSARGTVRVVHDISELDKVKEGDILVASMTIPEFVAAMEKAAAFITDEGGITCHAAIVSRELGVPCVIGTGDATRRLHDGDVVEVDATAGIVRIVDCPHHGV